MSMRRIFFIFLFSLLAMMLAACGGQQTWSPRSISVELTEFTITSDSLSAHVGEPLTFNVKNNGVLQHNVTIVDSANKELALVTVKPGEAAILDFEPMTSGELQIVCTVAGHHKAGMTAQLIVTP
jgi:uncharacterized cupredoxin-like copper-binding protein